MGELTSTSVRFSLRAQCRSKFQNYTAVTLGLEGEEGDKVCTRLWDAVDGQLKIEAGPGVDCLLTRVKSRCVCFSRRLVVGVNQLVCTFGQALLRAVLLMWKNFGILPYSSSIGGYLGFRRSCASSLSIIARWPDARHVHRLDQDTSGLVVLALTVEAAREMCRQFRERGKRQMSCSSGSGTTSGCTQLA